MPPTQQYCSHGNYECMLLLLSLHGFKEIIQSAASFLGIHGYTQCSHRLVVNPSYMKIIIFSY